MSASKQLFILVWFLLNLCGAAPAQDGPKFQNPDKIERATKADDKGMLQWDTYTPPKCPSCSGTGKMKCPTCQNFPEDATFCAECKRATKEREIPCYPCGGTGTIPDPLEKALCPGCRGAALLLCFQCSGGGVLRIQGSGDKWLQCPPCGKTGGWKCAVCNGERFVAIAGVKPSLKDANAATLTKAIAAVDQALKDLSAISPAGGERARKEVKAIAKAFDLAGAYVAAVKRTTKPFEDYMNKVYGGSQFLGHEENEAGAMSLVKTNAEYHLKHVKRMMELSLKRAEANAKLAAEQKGK